MNKDEVFEYLKKNLSVKLKRPSSYSSYNGFQVQLWLEEVLISESKEFITEYYCED